MPDPHQGAADWLAAIERETGALVRAADRAGLDRAVPSCPDWTVRDLVRHLGGVQRWATAHVREARQTVMVPAEADALMADHPGDPELLAWLQAGAQELVEVLAGASPGLQCWSFLPAPSPLLFWARRQAHETEIHRADAQLAAGAQEITFAAEAADDGIEELLFGFAARRRRVQFPGPVRLGLLPHDRPEGWTVELAPEGITAERGERPSQCRVRGSAAELYLLLWNRLPASSLEIEGDPDVLRLWGGAVRVTWS
ncbi:MAG TPA: maleylpyruvate isomerase family mycothiol-dependent enzyme [Candidatus Dormibacteraeota bacterium]